MGRIADIRATAQRKTGNLYDTYFTRQISVLITAALAPLRVPPNAVSTVNFGVGMTACCLIGFGAVRWHILLGVALVHLYAILDSVDGELARYNRQSSVKGLFLEDYSAFAMINAMTLAVALYLEHTTNARYPIWLAVGMAVLGRNAMAVARRTVLQVLEHQPSKTPTPATTTRPPKSSARTLIEDHLLHYTNIWVTLTTLIVVELTTGISHPIVLYAFTVYAALLIMKELATLTLIVSGDFLERTIALVRAANRSQDR